MRLVQRKMGEKQEQVDLQFGCRGAGERSDFMDREGKGDAAVAAASSEPCSIPATARPLRSDKPTPGLTSMPDLHNRSQR